VGHRVSGVPLLVWGRWRQSPAGSMTSRTTFARHRHRRALTCGFSRSAALAYLQGQM